MCKYLANFYEMFDYEEAMEILGEFIAMMGFELDDSADTPYLMEAFEEGTDDRDLSIDMVSQMNVGTVVVTPGQKTYVSVFFRAKSTATIQVQDQYNKVLENL